MSKSIRIRTTPNGEDKYIKVELKQDFDLLEILSLKIKQDDVYQNFCSDYGVIAGRIVVNNGYGVPNIKVSIFIPIESVDRDNSIISQLYPYESPTEDDKNVQGYKYNLLPNTQQTFDHTPVGTFPEKKEILDDKVAIEIYDKYYKFTTTTNQAGDFILFGIPLGEQILHYDMDLSDIGFLSARPYEMVAQGYAKELFESPFKFKREVNIAALPQIVSQNIAVLVQPFWCDNLATGRIMGINREDINLEPYTLIPTATFFGSVFSDDEKDSINKNCRPRRKTGKMREVITGEGKVEAIRRMPNGNIEIFDLPDSDIDENGNWAILVPMNLRKVITNEFGDIVPSPDGVIGVATEADYRFRISMDKTSNDKRLRQRANYLVPNLTGNYNFGEYSNSEVKTGDIFKLNKQLSSLTLNTPYSADTTNTYNYLEDFYSFRWKKVYTVKQFIGRYQKGQADEKRSFLGIKHILNGEGINKFPSNRTDTNVNPIYSLLCFLLGIFAMLLAMINSILQLFNGLITMLCQFRIPVGLRINFYWPMCFRFASGTIVLCTQGWKDMYASSTMNPVYSCSCPGTAVNACCGCNRKKSGSCKKKSYMGEPELTIELKWKCILAKMFCKKCKSLCKDTWPVGFSCCKCRSGDSCCNGTCAEAPNGCGQQGQSACYGCPCNKGYYTADLASGESGQCCCQCCIKVGLIGLKCPEESSFPILYPTLFPTPFAPLTCNSTLMVGKCYRCGGSAMPMIGAWVSCKLEGIAAFLNMLKFDFYNDWVNGSLYFPLIKRKYKVKTRKKKFGQIKKDKFCDFDCDNQPGSGTDPFQETGGDEYAAYIINWGIFPVFPTINGCNVIGQYGIPPKIPFQSDWFAPNPNAIPPITQSDAIDLAIQNLAEFLGGEDSTGQPCIPDLSVHSSSDWMSIFGIEFATRVRTKPGPHAKPDYISTNDPVTGIATQTNIGGHGHHQNKCNRTYRHEKLEWFRQNSSSCMIGIFDENPNLDGDNEDIVLDPGDDETSEDTMDDPNDSNCLNSFNTNCDWAPHCEFGVTSCTLRTFPVECDCLLLPGNYGNHKISHGIAKWEEGTIYYPSIIPFTDSTHNGQPTELKGNLLLPTDISECGSSVFCDIDDVPFIMDQLIPTTFQVSEESERFNFGDAGPPQVIDKIKDKGDAGVNLRGYVEFGCIGAHCLNTPAITNQSQIGIDIMDVNDIGLELGPCMIYMEHDVNLREYFCKRFAPYKDIFLNVHYQRPGSHEFENYYDTYPEHAGILGPTGGYTMPDGTDEPGHVNDGEPFISGDRCGWIHPDNNTTVNNFYGIDIEGADQMNAYYPINTFYQESQLGGTQAWNNNVGLNLASLHTPYHFYFGITPGKSALHKVVNLYFADKIDKVTLAGLPGSQSASQNINNQSNSRNTVKNPYSILKTCLGEKLTIKKQGG